MKVDLKLLPLALAVLLLAGCQTPYGEPDRTASGALIGGAIGAGTGAIIGGAAHNPAAGALIGGAFGAVTGAVVGNSMDQQQRAIIAQQSPVTLQRVDQGQPLALADVKALARAGVSDDLIISQIRTSGTVYHLSTAEIIDLKDSGVSPKVIDYMINTPSTVAAVAPAATAPVVATPAPVPAPIVEPVVVAPGPGYVWIDGGWIWGGDRWAWRRGYWALPPHPHAVWVHDGWVHGRGGYVWRHGHWR